MKKPMEIKFKMYKVFFYLSRKVTKSNRERRVIGSYTHIRAPSIDSVTFVGHKLLVTMSK